MINKNEIRLGNYFNYYENSCVGYVLSLQINSFSKTSKIAISINGGGYTVTDLEDLTPIEINEEILKKCVFNKFCKVEDNLLMYSRDGDDYWIIIKSIPDIKYLHKLQNVFEELSGEELKVNL